MPAQDQKTEKATILLVDDEAIIIDVTSRMLQKLGYNVLIARSGHEAVSMYSDNHDGIDLIILDIIMPGMGGRASFKALKDINPRAKVLISSGYSMEGEASEIMKNGCNGFLQKPFNVGQLAEKIVEVLGTEQSPQ